MQRTFASASLVAAIVVGVTFPYAANAQQAQLAQAGEDVAQGMSRERLARLIRKSAPERLASVV